MYNSQELYNVIKIKLKEQNKTAAGLIANCELSKNALQSMKDGYLPRLENICKIADYLNVSIDFLLGRNAPDTAEHTELMRLFDTAEHTELMRLFDTLDDDSKEIIARLIVKLADKV